MIWIPYKNAEPPKDWLKKSDDLTQQLIEAHQLGDIEARNKIIDDNRSHWGEIKGWLLELSNGKCWFSETKDLYSHLDVEHFRPKIEAKNLDGSKREDGYWWLAFDYRNYRACGNVGNRKKGGYFPLRKNSMCATFEDQCEDSEAFYLLDPIVPGDPELLAFDEQGNATPAPGVEGWDKERVEVTIKRMKLNKHEVLTQARCRLWKEMTIEIEQFLTAKSKLKRNYNPAVKERYETLFQSLRKKTQKEQPLSSVARWCILLRHEPVLKPIIG